MARALLYQDELLGQMRSCIRRATEFSFGLALISVDGLNAIAASLEFCLGRGGRGRVLIGIDMPTSPDAIEWLCELQERSPDRLTLRVFRSSERAIFHPKLSVFVSPNGHKSAIVGSGNLTRGGLVENYEASVFVDELRIVAQLQDFFDEHFKGGHARTITASWLQQYRAVFKARQLAQGAVRKAREKARKLQIKQLVSPPPRIRGFTFAFTGKITGWPRDERLFPYVRKLGGNVVSRAGATGKAHCLGHGNILDGRKSTRKLDAAHEQGIPIISDEEFFEIAKRQQRSRQP